MITLEAQAKQKLYLKRLLIDDKWVKLYDKKEAEVDEWIKKQYAKAERQVKQRLINQEKKIKNKQRAREGKPLLKVKKKKINRVKKCDDLFSQYIRVKYWSVCYTCWSSEHIGNWHCISRKIRSLRRYEDNCRPQCFYKCNAKFSGNGETAIFKDKLKRQWINIMYLEEQELLAKWPLGNKKPTEQELQGIYKRIKSDYDNLPSI